MKESKKVILGVMKKHLEKNDKFESQVLNLALKKIDGARTMGGAFTIQKAENVCSCR